jgi:hypothetical protein
MCRSINAYKLQPTLTNSLTETHVLHPFQNIRCFRILLTHMYLDAFYYIGSLILLLTYTLKDV